VLTVVVILLSVALLLGVGYFLRTRTPAFAVAQVERAIANRDVAAFEARVDIPMLVESTLDAALASGTEKVGGVFGAGLGKALLDRMKPQFQPRLEEEIRTQVREGTFSWDKLARLQGAELSMRLGELLGASNWTYEGHGPVRRIAPAEATARLHYSPPEGGTESVLLTLQKGELGWRVVRAIPGEADAE